MRSDTVKTRSKLISAAEILFAEKGIDGVSLGDINRKARQKNQRAVTYHFGNKSGLLAAIIDKHNERIEQRRAELLEVLPESPQLKQLIEVLFLPLVERLEDPDGGLQFIKISNYLAISDTYADFRRSLDIERSQIQKIMELLAVHVPDNYMVEREARDLVLNSLLFQTLPAFASSQDQISRKAYVDIIISAFEDVLTRPVSK